MWQRDRVVVVAAAAAAAAGKNCAGRAAERAHVEVAAGSLSETGDQAPAGQDESVPVHGVAAPQHNKYAKHRICNETPETILGNLPMSHLVHCSIAWDVLPPD